MDWDDARVSVTVSKCSENSRGKNSEINEELDRARASRANWGMRSTLGMGKNNWIIYLRDTGQSLYKYATLQEIQSQREYKHEDIENMAEKVQKESIGVWQLRSKC